MARLTAPDPFSGLPEPQRPAQDLPDLELTDSERGIVAADQALAGPAVPVSQLQPGDLLFYHTDPTAPRYISHVAMYLGNGWMIQAPEPGKNVEIVPADVGSEFAGAIRVNPAQAAAVAGHVA